MPRLSLLSLFSLLSVSPLLLLSPSPVASSPLLRQEEDLPSPDLPSDPSQEEEPLTLLPTTAPVDLLGIMKYPNAAFAYLDKENLLITSFAAFGTDTVAQIPDISAAIRANITLAKPSVISSSVTWPNEAKSIPKDAIPGFPDVLVVAGGFLVPGKGNGAITLIDRKTGKQQAISNVKNLFFHQVEWMDIDNDGLLDIVTAGASKPIVGSGQASLFWLKQPAKNPLGTTWQTTKVIDGPDVFFSIEDLDGDGALDMLVPQFFSNKLMLYRKLDWLNPSKGFIPTLIDDKIGPLFQAFPVDLNGDGKKEILCTNHVGDSKGGAMYVYELPSFKKKLIADGFVNRLSGPGQASPGAPFVVYPTANSTLPSILLAGDGSGMAYLFTPKDKEFNYEQSLVVDVGKNTVGHIAAGDVDNDGKAEIFIPIYDAGQIYVYRFK